MSEMSKELKPGEAGSGSAGNKRTSLRQGSGRQAEEQLYIFGARWLIFVEIILAIIVARWLFIFIVLAAAGAWALAAILQRLFHRTRPFIAQKTKPLIKLWIPSSSFPSAHSAIAFAVATVIAVDSTWWGILFIVMAALVAWSRVKVRVHYVSDIIAGAALGSIYALIMQPLLLIALGIIIF